jgi:transcriptional antiterminator RfaH
MGKEPLFPGYGFIWLIEGIHDFAPLRHTKGMTGLVRLGGRPARVDNSLIDELRSRENADGVHTIYKLHYLPGDEVRIKSGPFKFYTAVVTAASGAERVRLLFENASRNMTVEVATEILEPVQA